MNFHVILLAAALGTAAAQPPAGTPQGAALSSLPKVELQGKIERVQVTQGGGAPFIEVKQGEKSTRVYLGSMRYLMEQSFNPKAGEEVSVKGYQRDSDVIASSVTLKALSKTIQFRDESGRPVWRGGRNGKGPHGQRGGAASAAAEPEH
jgi:hypothetical protein